MRKRTVQRDGNEALPSDSSWLNVDALASVEITSEDSAHPIESALLTGRAPGWRAAGPGEQIIRLLFDQPQRLRRIHMQFSETGRERTQEYVLRWSPDRGRSYREIVRQQWNFDPNGSTIETEDHHVDLQEVTILELKIVPDIAGRNAVASLAQLRLG